MTIKGNIIKYYVGETREYEKHLKEMRNELLDILQRFKDEENSISIEEIRKEIHTIVDDTVFGKIFKEEIEAKEGEISIFLYALLRFCNQSLARNRSLLGRKLHYKDIHKKISYKKSRYKYKNKLICL